MNEREEAVVLANKILERPFADPDDDLAMLSRQLLRHKERADRRPEQAVIEQLRRAYNQKDDVLFEAAIQQICRPQEETS